MHLKDYYNFLDIETSATQAEIKKAYRKLAHQYHPDKNQDDPYALARFTEIKEAYEVLTNPAKKEYYLQQRWYDQSMGKRKTQDIITPVTVLKQLLELDKFVYRLDVHRMDKQGLADYIGQILSSDTIARLLSFHEPPINQQIIMVTLKTMEPLPVKQATPVVAGLFKLAGEEDTVSNRSITDFLARKTQKERNEKYQPFILIFIVMIICFFIWLMGR
jgi:hypothetical protein